MSYMETYIDLTGESPEVDTGLKNRKGAYDSVRLSLDNLMIRLNPDTVVRAFLQIASHGIREGVLTPESIGSIRKYLDTQGESL